MALHSLLREWCGVSLTWSEVAWKVGLVCLVCLADLLLEATLAIVGFDRELGVAVAGSAAGWGSPCINTKQFHKVRKGNCATLHNAKICLHGLLGTNEKADNG
jgi:hypothetical protein